MPITLYYVAASPPCRMVHLVVTSLEIEIEFKEVDLQNGEHLQPEFLKLNPHHTVPTLVDEDGFVLWESRAIARYLIKKYGKGSNLYPEDPKTRAIIDQRLDFDLGTLYKNTVAYFYPQVFLGEPADEGLLKKIEESLELFNAFLEGYKFAAGDDLTLADLALVVTVSGIDAADISLDPYPNVKRWFNLVRDSLPHYEKVNKIGIEAIKYYTVKNQGSD